MSTNKTSSSSSILPTAGRLSVTIIHDSTKSYGLRLSPYNKPECNSTDGIGCDSHDDNNGGDIVIDMIANTHTNGMFKGSPLEEGDLLRTINNRRATEFLRCRDSNNVDGFSSYIRGGSFKDGQAVTFVAERPSKQDNDERTESSDSAIVRAFCRKSTSSNSNNNNRRAMAVGVEFHRVVVGEDDDKEVIDGNSESDADSDCDNFSSPPSSPASTKSSSSSSASSSFLQIDKIDPNGLFAHSVLNQGDIVLAINGYSICADENITVEEANELLGIHPPSKHAPSSSSSSSSPPKAEVPGVSVYETVDILALNPRKLNQLKRHRDDSRTVTRNSIWGSKLGRNKAIKERAKKAGVALGGGAMIGAGLVIHPFGPLLMASGVSVLGTEFETPVRMVRSARDSLKKWAVENPVPENQHGDSQQRDNLEAALSASSATGSVWKHREPVGERMVTQSNASTEREDTGVNERTRCKESATSSTVPPLSPLPTMANRMKAVSRRFVLPFLDRMAGDRRPNNTNIESTSSFDILDNSGNVGAGTKIFPEQQQPWQQRQQWLQGRDDDCGHDYGSISMQQDQQSSSISHRVA